MTQQQIEHLVNSKVQVKRLKEAKNMIEARTLLYDMLDQVFELHTLAIDKLELRKKGFNPEKYEKNVKATFNKNKETAKHYLIKHINPRLRKTIMFKNEFGHILND